MTCEILRAGLAGPDPRCEFCGVGMPRRMRADKASLEHVKRYRIRRFCGRTCRYAARLRIPGVTTRDSREYNIWLSMIKRCHSPGASPKEIRNYQLLGVEVCPRWRDSFEAFCEDVGPRPSLLHSLDRYPNNKGNYEPGNVRWATAAEQNRNTRVNHPLTINGVTKVLTDWARQVGLNEMSITKRLRKGMSPAEAVFTPRKTFSGLSKQEWQKQYYQRQKQKRVSA